MESTAFDRTFKDNQGNLAIFQKPNLPSMVGLAALLFSISPISPFLQTLFGAIAYGAIFTWSWLELFQGVNYFRRILGLVVLVIAIVSQLD